MKFVDDDDDDDDIRLPKIMVPILVINASYLLLSSV